MRNKAYFRIEETKGLPPQVRRAYGRKISGRISRMEFIEALSRSGWTRRIIEWHESPFGDEAAAGYGIVEYRRGGRYFRTEEDEYMGTVRIIESGRKGGEA